MENKNAYAKIDAFFSGAPSHTVKSSVKRGFAPRKAKVQPRWGRRCPNCSIQMPVSGICDCQ